MYRHNYNANWLYGTFESDKAVIVALLDLYCCSRSSIWNYFFGYKYTNNENISIFYIPHSEFEKVRLFIEEAID